MTTTKTTRVEFSGGIENLFDAFFNGGVPSQVMQYTPTTCAKCGVRFCLDKEHRDRLKQNGQTFYCPNGHQLWFGKSDAEQQVDKLKVDLAREAKKRETLETRLREERDYADQQTEEAKSANRRAAAARGQVTRIKNRVANGVCPCCNRSFANLQRHMASQHPDFQHEGEGVSDAN